MINKIQPNQPTGYTNGVHRVEGKLEVVQTKAHDATAEVSLSNDALALQRATKAVKEAPDVRVDVVESIRTQLEAGTYQVNTERLAEKLLPLLQ